MEREEGGEGEREEGKGEARARGKGKAGSWTWSLPLISNKRSSHTFDFCCNLQLSSFSPSSFLFSYL